MAFGLEDEFASLADELRAGLTEVGEPGLADQVVDLRVVDRCRCGDDFCAMMYTEQPPRGAWGATLRNVEVPVADDEDEDAR